MAAFIQVNGVAWQMAQGENPDELRDKVLAFADRGEQLHLQVAPAGGDGRETLTLDTSQIWSLLVYEADTKGRSGTVW